MAIFLSVHWMLTEWDSSAIMRIVTFVSCISFFYRFQSSRFNERELCVSEGTHDKPYNFPMVLRPNRSNNATSSSSILNSAARTSSSQSSFLKVPLSLSTDGYHIWWLWTQLRSSSLTPRGTNHSEWFLQHPAPFRILRMNAEPIFRPESRKASESLSIQADNHV